jgi:hypothetical protein
MWRYPLNGRPTAFWRGDWYVGKGVASALIRHSSGQLIEVFNTHVCVSPVVLIVVACSIRTWRGHLLMSSDCAGLGYSQATSSINTKGNDCSGSMCLYNHLMIGRRF